MYIMVMFQEMHKFHAFIAFLVLNCSLDGDFPHRWRAETRPDKCSLSALRSYAVSTYLHTGIHIYIYMQTNTKSAHNSEFLILYLGSFVFLFLMLWELHFLLLVYLSCLLLLLFPFATRDFGNYHTSIPYIYIFFFKT